MIDRKVISWPFFVSRFEVIINEVQNYDIHQKQFNDICMPKESESPGRTSDTSDKPAISGKKRHPTSQTVRSLSANLKFPYKRTVSAPGGMGLSAKASNISAPPNLSTLVVNTHPSFMATGRQQSAPILKNKNSKEHSLSKQVSNVATVIDELEYINIAAKTVDIEQVDKETIHLLVFLFMQFLSHAEQASGKSANLEEETTKKDNDNNVSYANQPCGKVSARAFQVLDDDLSANRCYEVRQSVRMNRWR